MALRYFCTWATNLFCSGYETVKRWHAFGLLLVACLSGCSTLPGATTDTLEGRTVEYVLAGQGAPAVVFENGLGAKLDWWSKVWPDSVALTRSLAYNRAGYGRSDVSARPRDGAQVVDELRALLKARQLPPPYVLVGHSLGGLYMQLYARQYPEEVAALVLVDSTHPEQFKGAGNPDQWPTWLNILFKATTSDTAKQELAALDATGEMVSRMPVDPSIPVWVLSASRVASGPSALAEDAQRKRVELAKLYPDSTQVWVDSGHAIPLEKPEAVVDAVRQAVLTARGSRDVRKTQ